MYENLDSLLMYEILYLKDDNSQEMIHYPKLVDLYNTYLTIFLLSDSCFYQDVYFLSSVVDGFSYFYNSIFKDEKGVNLPDIEQYILKKDPELRQSPFMYIENGTITDKNYILTSACIHSLKRDGLVDFSPELVIEMCYNSYKIEKVYQKTMNNTYSM